MMTRTLITSIAMSFVALSTTVAAELRVAPIAVIELFTSQGCSSCPPADAVLADIGQRVDVIALAYHVDYWDYVGWTDTFGRPENSDFQRSYAAARGIKRIYTPQLMVNGVEDVVGSRRQDVVNALDGAALPVAVFLKLEGDVLDVSAAGNASWPESKLWLVTFRQADHVDITRGENSDRGIDYTHIVTGRRVLGMWEPMSGATLKLPLGEILGEVSDGAAIIVQTDHGGLPGQVIGAASVAL